MGEVNTAFVKQYESNLMVLSQAKEKLAGTVHKKTGVTGTEFYQEQIGEDDSSVRTSRHPDTPIQPDNFSRRRGVIQDHQWARLLDPEDELKMLIDPKAQIVNAGALALARARDRKIADEANATAYGGADGTTPIAFPAGNTVAVDFGGSSSFSVEKIIELQRLLDVGDVEDMDRFIALTGNQIADLLNTTPVTSADYNSVKALVNGSIDSFVGFKFVKCSTSVLNTDTSGYREVLAYCRTGICLGEQKAISGKVDQRPDKSYAWQAYASTSFGVTRLEEAKVMVSLNEE